MEIAQSVSLGAGGNSAKGGSMTAPIALFVYARPEHTRRTVEALQQNAEAAESDLYIFSDGPKTPEVALAVAAVRNYVRNIVGFRSITLVEREENLGLANSIIDGVTRLCKEYGRVIVLEDDLIASPYLLQYMNRALEKYAGDEQVMQISGYMFPVKIKTEEDVFFLPLATSWGWATWQRAWRHFDPGAHGYEELRNDQEKRKAFDLNGSYPYFKMLESQLNGEVDSWAIRWWLSVFIRSGLVLYPRFSLIENIGFDGSGTHGDKCGFAYHHRAWGQKIEFPDRAALSVTNYNAVVRFMRITKFGGIQNWIRRIFRWPG